jgi:O-antigen ligase
VDTWRAIIRVVSEHPLDGVGFSGLGYVLPAAGEALGVEVKDTAHNTYLRFLGEMGVLGLLLFLALLWSCWTLARDGMRLARDRADRQLALGFAAATIALAISCAFGDRFFSTLISGNFWLAGALVNDLVSERRAEAA